MICWMFPGQPVAVTEMPAGEPEFQKIALLCQETTGYNPIESCTSASGISESVRLQLFGACITLYRLHQLTGRGIEPNLIAEHSMGIYPALAASGSIDFATVLALTCRIGAAMAELGMQREYAVACVIGLTCQPLEAIAANNGVYIANHNTSRHFLLAGERVRIEAAAIEANASGAFSVSLFPCDAPIHTPLIGEITGDLHQIVSSYSFSEPGIPLIEHIGQTALSAATLPEFLVDEVCRPVFWERTYRFLRSRGVTRFQEVGIGSGLSKFNRWIDSET